LIVKGIVSRKLGIIEITLVKMRPKILIEAQLNLNSSMHKQPYIYIKNKERMIKYYNSSNLV